MRALLPGGRRAQLDELIMSSLLPSNREGVGAEISLGAIAQRLDRSEHFCRMAGERS